MIIVLVIVLVIGLIIGGIFGINYIRLNNVKGQLSQINAKEFEEKLINELKNTSLNVNTESMETVFDDEIDENTGMVLKFYYDLVMHNNSKNGQGYVFAFVSDKTDKERGVAIPCFKIESDSNGNFKNITFPSNTSSRLPLRRIVWDTVVKVLKNEYNIDASKYEINKGKEFIAKGVGIMMTDKNSDFAMTAFEEIVDNTYGYSWSNVEDDMKRGYGIDNISQEMFGVDTI